MCPQMTALHTENITHYLYGTETHLKTNLHVHQEALECERINVRMKIKKQRLVTDIQMIILIVILIDISICLKHCNKMFSYSVFLSCFPVQISKHS